MIVISSSARVTEFSQIVFGHVIAQHHRLTHSGVVRGYEGVADVGEQPMLVGVGRHGSKQKKIPFSKLISIYLSISGKCTNAFGLSRDGTLRLLLVTFWGW